jgi:hypothetical protein
LSAQTPHACSASLARATRRVDPLGSREHQGAGENGSEDERYRIVDGATWQSSCFRHCAPGWPAAARTECRMAFSEQKEVWKIRDI